MELICRHCHTSLTATDRFCRSCGQAQVPGVAMADAAVYCRFCGNAMGPTDQFCRQCGKAQETTSAEITAPAKDLFAHLSAGEQRPATVLMADLTGYSTLVEYANPEAVFHLLNTIFAELVECLIAHGAYIDKYVGDEIIALFGVPVAQEDYIERAVRAALAMQQAFAAMNQDGRFGGSELMIHIGIHVGTVMVGRVGHHSRADFTVIGDTVNVAKRLEEEAPGGQIYVSGDVHDAVTDLFYFQEIGLQSVKGRRQAVPTFRVLEVNLTASLDSLAECDDIACIGRTREFALLKWSAEDVLTDHDRRLCLTGTPGIGKTHLLAAWRKSTQARHFRQIRVSCRAFSEHFPLLPVVELATQLLGLAVDGWPPRVIGDIDRALADSALSPAHGAALKALFASITGATTDDPGWQDSAAEAIASLLILAVAQRPVAIILEDIHWMDESSRSLFARIWNSPLPGVLLLCSARTPAETWAAQVLAAEVIVLAPMTPADIEQLLYNWAAPARLPAEVLQRVALRAQGQPYFARELLKELQQGRDAAGMPLTLQELFLTQLDQLPVPLRQFVQAASVVGDPLVLSLVAVALPDDAILSPELLENAVQLGLLSRGATAESFFIDRHLLFETAYSTIPPTQRQHQHARIADHLRDQLAQFGESAVHAAAHHAYLGFADARALDLLLRSTRLFHAQYANQQVIDTAGRIIGIISALLDSAQYLEQRIEALLFIAKSYQILGQLETAECTLAEATLLADDSTDADLIAQIAQASATLALMRGDARTAEGHYRHALTIWEGLNNVTRVAHASLGLGMCALSTGDRARAFTFFTRAIEQSADALWMKAAALNNAGMLLVGEGRYAEAEPYLRDSLRANREDGDLRGSAHSAASLGELLFRQGRWHQAQHQLEEALALALQVEEVQCLRQVHLLLARVLVRFGDLSGARRYLHAATTPEPTPADALAEAEVELAETGGIPPACRAHCAEQLAPSALTEPQDDANANLRAELFILLLRHATAPEAETLRAGLAVHLPAIPDSNLRVAAMRLLTNNDYTG